MDYLSIGGFIYSERKKHKLTQAELAVMLQVEPQTVSRWERGIGAPDISQLIPIAKIFGVSVEDLLNGESAAHISKEQVVDSVIQPMGLVSAYYAESREAEFEDTLFGECENKSTDNKFRFRDFFQPSRMLKGFNKFMGGSGKIETSWKLLIKDNLKKRSRLDTESILTQGMFRKEALPNFGEIEPPWMFIRLFILILGLMIIAFAIGFVSPIIIPLVLVLASALIPLSLLCLIFEINYPRNISIIDLLTYFFFGGLLSIIFALLIGSIGTRGSFVWALSVGFGEEIAKVLAIYIFIKKIKPKYILSGMLVGAAIGAGFSIFETSGYGFIYFMDSILLGDPLAYENMLSILLIRGLTEIGAGHLFWGAISGGAMVMVFGNNQINIKKLFNSQFIKIFLLVVLLHSAWDYTKVIFYPFICITGLVLLAMQLNVGLAQYQLAKTAYEIYGEDEV